MNTHIEKDGTIRQDHYGAGRQPWDDIKDTGWGPHFAAGNVLKYLRRTKHPEHSLESARWYFRELRDLSLSNAWNRPAVKAFEDLCKLLTPEEIRKLL